VALVAGAWAGFNAWNEQRGRTLPLDLDSWGHRVATMQAEGRSLRGLFADPSLFRGPVVPFVFGLCYFVAPVETSVLAFNALWFALTAGVLFDAFRRLGAARWAALAAVLLWVFYPPSRLLFGYYYAEPVLGLLSAALFWLAARMLVRPGGAAALATGLVAGVLLLARGPFILVILALPFALWLIRRVPLRVLAWYAAGVAFAFSPWLIRNLIVERELIPFTTEGGLVMFQGTWQRGDAVRIEWLRKYPEYRELEEGAKGKSEVEQDRYWRSLALAQVRDDPGGEILLCVKKGLRFWAYVTPNAWTLEGMTAPLVVVTLALAAAGSWRNRRAPLAQLCLLWVCGLWLVHAVIYAEMRYSFPVLPMLYLLAVSAFSRPALVVTDAPAAG
jgi:hypothetical protein